jgi:hypothetical protein
MEVLSLFWIYVLLSSIPYIFYCYQTIFDENAGAGRECLPSQVSSKAKPIRGWSLIPMLANILAWHVLCAVV